MNNTSKLNVKQNNTLVEEFVMGNYSIKDIERISGIKAHTLRIWEKRYGIIEPSRTETNIRYYTNEELKKILNISILNNYGIKISKIVGLSGEELHKKVLEISTEEVEENLQIESLVIAMVEVDESRFEKILANCTLRLGFEQTLLSIIYPFFKKVGVLWQAGAINPAQEHFISNLIRQKLIVAIDSQGMMVKEGASKFLLFLPEGELHELGLLFYSYLIQKSGHKVIYLGQSVPLDDVVKVNELNPADYIITATLSMSAPESVNKLLQKLLDIFPSQKVILTNRFDDESEILENERLVFNQSLSEFKSFLDLP
ncbi:MerR family transcriptional regulator [Cryomorphaceae bacterium 1068]|nr:MerR family transcriptional regulator [Cryomorphaceae bacterium 1068]